MQLFHLLKLYLQVLNIKIKIDYNLLLTNSSITPSVIESPIPGTFTICRFVADVENALIEEIAVVKGFEDYYLSETRFLEKMP